MLCINSSSSSPTTCSSDFEVLVAYLFSLPHIKVLEIESYCKITSLYNPHPPHHHYNTPSIQSYHEKIM